MSHTSNKTKTLFNNNLDSFQHFSRGIGNVSLSVTIPENAPENVIPSSASSHPSPSTFSVSDYFENNIAGRNLRRDSMRGEGHIQDTRHSMNSTGTQRESQDATQDKKHVNLTNFTSPQITMYKPAKRMSQLMKNRDGFHGTVVQATTRTIGQNLFGAANGVAQQQAMTVNTVRSPSASPESTAATPSNELSPVQKRAMNMERRVELVEMRSRQLQWMKTFEREKDAMQDEIAVLRQTKQDVQKERAQLMSEAKQMEKGMHALREQNIIYQKQVEDLHMQISSLKEQLNQKHASGLQPLADEYNRITQQSRRELKEAQEQLMEAQEASRTALQEKERQIDALRQQLEQYESKMHALTTRLETLHTQNIQLKQRQDSDVGTLQSELDSLREQHTQLQSANERLFKQVEKLTTENSHQKKQLESLQTSNQTLLEGEMQLRQRYTKELKERDTRIKQLEQEIELKPMESTTTNGSPASVAPNPSNLQTKLLKICTNLTTIESLIPGITAKRNDDIDEYELSDLAEYVERQSGRLCRLIREKIEDETENQLGGGDDCVIS